MKTKKTIIPLGVPRSGTSMLAGILRCLGVDMGDEIKPDKHEDLAILWKPTEEIINVIKEYNNRKEVWGFKTPWIGNHIEELHEHLINPKFILVLREEEDCIRSELKRNNNTRRRGILNRNNGLMDNIKSYLGKHPDNPAFTFTYKQIITNPELYVKGIIDFLELTPTKEQIESAVNFIKPGDYRTI